MHEPEPLNPSDTARETPQAGEQPTHEKERLQREAPRHDRVRDRGPNTGGGNFRPSDR